MGQIWFYVALDAGLIGQIRNGRVISEGDYVRITSGFHPRVRDGRIELGYRPDMEPGKAEIAPGWAVLEMRYFTQADGEWIDHIVPVEQVDILLEFLMPYVWDVQWGEYRMFYAPDFEVTQVKAFTSPRFFSGDAIRKSAYPAELVYKWLSETGGDAS